MPDAPSPDIATEWLDRLQASGYRLTAARRAVVAVVAQSKRILSPQQVYERARTSYRRLGLVTVYRTLEKLEELGVVQRVHQPDGCHAFIATAPGHAHLLLCQNCGQAVYFFGDDLDTFISAVAAWSQFSIKDHWLQLFGMCSQCHETAVQG